MDNPNLSKPSTMESLSSPALEYLINHLFLPPKLPEKDDFTIRSEAQVKSEVLLWVGSSLQAFAKLSGESNSSVWDMCIEAMSNMRDVMETDGKLSASKLDTALKSLQSKGALSLHIQGQNAGILVHSDGDTVLVSSFEVSPTNEATIGCSGALIREFPGSAVRLKAERLGDADFPGQLAGFLAQMDRESIEEALPKTRKAGSDSVETRDTASPMFITELLSGLLLSFGKMEPTYGFRKHYRDDVIDSSTHDPWRRSPFLTVVKVTIQLLLHDPDSEHPHQRYKSFMLFLLAGVLKEAMQQNQLSETLYVLTCKVALRVRKLEGRIPEHLMEHLIALTKACKQLLDKKWSVLQDEERGSGISIPLPGEPNTHLKLGNLRTYLNGLSDTSKENKARLEPHPKTASRIQYEFNSLPDPSLLDNAFEFSNIPLMDLEHWVCNHLDSWAERQTPLGTDHIQDKLSSLLECYLVRAQEAYKGFPEELSIMILTSFHLWVVLDKASVSYAPLLRDYDPGFNLNTFEGLLLPHLHQLAQLAKVKAYIRERKQKSNSGRPPPFERILSSESLLVRYFDSSPKCSVLRTCIEREAAVERDRKLEEFRRKMAEYDALMKRSNDIYSHTYYTDIYGGRHHSSSCKKCNLSNRAQSIDISIHEWPLPKEENAAKSAVAELCLDGVVSRWRDLTYSLLFDPFSVSGSAESTRLKDVYFARSYVGLGKYVTARHGRVCIASKEKSFMGAHYSNPAQKVTTFTEATICKLNGLQYRLYDSTALFWTGNYIQPGKARHYFEPSLRSELYKPLQFALPGTAHTSNEVIARQTDCHRDLSLHEFCALGELRSGNRLQWRSLTMAIANSSLNFEAVDVHTFVLQAAWQVECDGNDSTTIPLSHKDLEEELFTKELLEVLDKAVYNLKSNWKGVTAMRTYILLAMRILSLSPHGTIKNQAFEVLQHARQYSYGWLEGLVQMHKFSTGSNTVERQQVGFMVAEVAITCLTTFNPSLMHSGQETTEAIGIAVECAVRARMHLTDSSAYDMPTQTMIRRHHRLLHDLESPLMQLVRPGETAGVSLGISRVYSQLNQDCTWTAPSSNSGWIQCAAPISTVSLNILDGRLLVNGLPISRLPARFERHSDFKNLFNDRILDVTSLNGGMEFVTSSSYFHRTLGLNTSDHERDGHDIYFSMCNEKLVIKTTYRGTEYTYIPFESLRGDLPREFVEEYVHWSSVNKDSDTTSIEIVFCPRDEKQWDLQETAWVMFLDGIDGKGILHHRSGSNWDYNLVESSSVTGEGICNTLRPLETGENIHIILNIENRTYIKLPRLGLDLELQEPHVLHCQNYDMAVDSCQDIGTLTGLKSKLVLCRGVERRVLVPFGAVSWRRKDDHVEVDIDTGRSKRVKFSVFDVESDLDRLGTSGSTRCQLFKAYLHAVTSHCLPDRLTGRTGTEEALRDLSSAKLQSFTGLGPEEIGILELLAELTPTRSYYPVHLKVIQNVKWDKKLPSLSQHEHFISLVDAIFVQFRRQQVFSGGSQKLPDVKTGTHLQQRAAYRNAAYYVDVPSLSIYNFERYVRYDSRDRPRSYTKLQDIASHCRLADTWTSSLSVCENLLARIEGFGKTVNGIEAVSPDGSYVGFDICLLSNMATWLPQNFCSIQSRFSKITTSQKYGLMFFLATCAFSQDVDLLLVRTLLALATVVELKDLRPPTGPFELSEGYSPSESTLLSKLSLRFETFSQKSDEWDMQKLSHESYEAYFDRKQRTFRTRQEEKASSIVQRVFDAWNNKSTPLFHDLSLYGYIKSSGTSDATQLLEVWRRNLSFKKYVADIQKILDRIQGTGPPSIPIEWTAVHFHATNARVPTELKYLLQRASPLLTDGPAQSQYDPEVSLLSNRLDSINLEDQNETQAHLQLRQLMDDLDASANTTHERRYLDDLRSSFESLCADQRAKDGISSAVLSHICENSKGYHGECLRSFNALENTLRQALQPTSTVESVLFNSGLWPRLCRTSLLAQLSSQLFNGLSDSWQGVFIRYGLSFSNLQRANRLLYLSEKYLKSATNDDYELRGEIRNEGHSNWVPRKNPDWLLFEIENNILIRPQQIDIATLMMHPTGGSNTVMQLNMGEGKSSVIAPIVATSLADTTRLVRIFVLKSLSSQMFELLAQKLGGLLGRRIFYLPFSRNVVLDSSKVRMIEELFQECLDSGGILLVQPEHVLSFELMGYDRTLAGDLVIGKECLRLQKWLNSVTRDILDESDEILSVKYELVYTIGLQRDIDFAPERWKIITDVLSSVRSNAQKVKDLFPDDVDLETVGPKGRFPRMRFFSVAAQDDLAERVLGDICDGSVQSARSRLPKDLVRSFIQSTNSDTKDALTIKALIGDDSSNIWSILLVLRGFITCGLLRFTLGEKRYRVNYGLDPSRSSLAVPFRAKDSPAARAEFSHPDVTIILTALCYYYEGLTVEQLTLCFKTLDGLESRQEEYGRWVIDADTGLDPEFHAHGNVNLRDKQTFSTKLFPGFRYSKAVIDFYLSHVVFPKEAKEFPHKLSCSGWDIAKPKIHPTTGFSGTNDSRYLLPLDMVQCDNPKQHHTNAGVLGCILRPENVYLDLQMWDSSCTSKALISTFPANNIQVILDVGAQILDLKNFEVAKFWLNDAFDAHVEKARHLSHAESFSRPKAVVFFGEGNQLMVYSLNGLVEPLMVSPYYKQLDQCIIYLDEAHTRGTDLKLPSHYKAVVTLGPSLTKDRLVQACMRMRKLGKGQSLTFIAPPEVRKSIKETTGNSDISVSDVLQWSISETWKHTQRSTGLWFTQGARYQTQQSVHERVGDTVYSLEDVKSLLEDEAKTLEQRYGGQQDEYTVNESLLTPARIANIDIIRRKCEETGLLSAVGASVLQEEQERELSPEAEREVEIERPPGRTPKKHFLHQDVLKFIRTGKITMNASGTVFKPAFSVFQRTTASKNLPAKVNTWSSQLLVTTDFSETVEGEISNVGDDMDFYLRPVNWVLSSTENPSLLVIISPYEANEALSDIKSSPHVRLHIYAPPTQRSSEALDNLTRFVFPNRLTSQSIRPTEGRQNAIRILNLFSGQLYFESYQYYLGVCSFLGLAPTATNEHSAGVALDGFVEPSARATLASRMIVYTECPFERSPVPFMSAVLAMRRKGASVEGTDLGDLLAGIPLSITQLKNKM